MIKWWLKLNQILLATLKLAQTQYLYVRRIRPNNSGACCTCKLLGGALNGPHRLLYWVHVAGTGYLIKWLVSVSVYVNQYYWASGCEKKQKKKNRCVSSVGKYSCWKLIQLKPKCWFASTTATKDHPSHHHIPSLTPHGKGLQHWTHEQQLPARHPPVTPLSFLSVFAGILSDDWLSGVKGSRVRASHFWPPLWSTEMLCSLFCLRASSASRRWTRLHVFSPHRIRRWCGELGASARAPTRVRACE